MIKINLMRGVGTSNSVESSNIDLNDKIDAEKQRQDLLVRTLIVFLFPIALYVYQQQILPDKKSLMSSKMREFDELVVFNQQASQSTEQIKKTTEVLRVIEEKISKIEAKTKNRTREARFLELIQKVIPAKIWLTDLDYAAGRVTLKGYAPNDADIFLFTESLSKSKNPALIDVNLISSSEQATKDSVLKRFEIACLMENFE